MRLCSYTKQSFAMKKIKKIEYTMKNMEDGIESDIHYEWIKMDELEEYPLKPQKIINVIKSGEYPVHLINED